MLDGFFPPDSDGAGPEPFRTHKRVPRESLVGMFGGDRAKERIYIDGFGTEEDGIVYREAGPAPIAHHRSRSAMEFRSENPVLSRRRYVNARDTDHLKMMFRGEIEFDPLTKQWRQTRSRHKAEGVAVGADAAPYVPENARRRAPVLLRGGRVPLPPSGRSWAAAPQQTWDGELPPGTDDTSRKLDTVPNVDHQSTRLRGRKRAPTAQSARSGTTGGYGGGGARPMGGVPTSLNPDDLPGQWVQDVRDIPTLPTAEAEGARGRGRGRGVGGGRSASAGPSLAGAPLRTNQFTVYDRGDGDKHVFYQDDAPAPDGVVRGRGRSGGAWHQQVSRGAERYGNEGRQRTWRTDEVWAEERGGGASIGILPGMTTPTASPDAVRRRGKARVRSASAGALHSVRDLAPQPRTRVREWGEDDGAVVRAPRQRTRSVGVGILPNGGWDEGEVLPLSLSRDAFEGSGGAGGRRGGKRRMEDDAPRKRLWELCAGGDGDGAPEERGVDDSGAFIPPPPVPRPASLEPNRGAAGPGEEVGGGTEMGASLRSPGTAQRGRMHAPPNSVLVKGGTLPTSPAPAEGGGTLASRAHWRDWGGGGLGESVASRGDRDERPLHGGGSYDSVPLGLGGGVVVGDEEGAGTGEWAPPFNRPRRGRKAVPMPRGVRGWGDGRRRSASAAPRVVSVSF